uniref:Uncharacterized protein n=1 Tax=Nelumbo nucifera TaxID=4432 RepID=A0A822ZQY7_NELNU|nr:TPA_asm: hypothetical protein HUJ06_018321 [Nelumbo nucifera]
MKSTINDKDKLSDKIDSDGKEKMESTPKEALEWLDENHSAEDNYKEKLKEVEAVCNQIIKQVHEKSDWTNFLSPVLLRSSLTGAWTSYLISLKFS